MYCKTSRISKKSWKIMKKFSEDDLRFIYKALRWAEQDRISLADAWGHIDSPEGKGFIKEAKKCEKLRKAIGKNLKDGGKSLECLADVLEETPAESYLVLSEIKAKHKEG